MRDPLHQKKGSREPGLARRSPGTLENEIASLRARVDELERAGRDLADFAALAAHELQKPLILAEACAAGLLQDTGPELDIGARVELEMLVDVASRMRLLVETLLADAQPDAALAREPVDLTSVVRDCVAMLSTDITARRAPVEIGPLPVVHGNAVLLTAVFRNLLVNALEHGSGSEIRIFAEPTEAGWTFAVDSKGRPIPPEERRRIFQSPSRRGRRAQGGLGLVLVRRIVERHGGVVGVTSPDRGMNRFFFTLPGSNAGQAEVSRIR